MREIWGLASREGFSCARLVRIGVAKLCDGSKQQVRSATSWWLRFGFDAENVEDWFVDKEYEMPRLTYQPARAE